MTLEMSEACHEAGRYSLCRLFGAKSLAELYLIFNWILWDLYSVKLESTYKDSHRRKWLWFCVDKMAAILSRPQCIDNMDDAAYQPTITDMYLYKSWLSYISRLTCWGLSKMTCHILLTKLQIDNPWMETFESEIIFHWNVFLGVWLTLCHHWFR